VHESLLGVEDAEADDEEIRVYPNPAQDRVNIEGNLLRVATAKVYDARGKEVYSFSLNSRVNTLDVASWPAGTYTIELITERGVSVKKLIISR
jgi:hypothetical protein